MLCEEPGFRDNRQRLREFQGSQLDEESDDFQDKVHFADENLSQGDVTLAGDILGIDYKGDKRMVIQRIVAGLRNRQSLQRDAEKEEDNSKSSDEEGEERSFAEAASVEAVHEQPFAVSFRDVRCRREID